MKIDITIQATIRDKNNNPVKECTINICVEKDTCQEESFMETFENTKEILKTALIGTK